MAGRDASAFGQGAQRACPRLPGRGGCEWADSHQRLAGAVVYSAETRRGDTDVIGSERSDALGRLVEAGWERMPDGSCRLGGASPWQPSLIANPCGMPAVDNRRRWIPTLTLMPSLDLLDDADTPDAGVAVCDTLDELVELALEVQNEFEATLRDVDEQVAQADADETEFAGIISASGGMPAAQAVAAGWHDYAHALLLAMGAMRMVCGRGAYRDYPSAVSDLDVAAVCDQASGWVLEHLSDALEANGSGDLFDTVAAAAAEHLAHQIASECNTAGLAEAVTAPWQAGDSAEVSCEEFVSALRAATSDDRPLPSPAQAEAAATDLRSMVSPGSMHTGCDFDDDDYDNEDLDDDDYDDYDNEDLDDDDDDDDYDAYADPAVVGYCAECTMTMEHLDAVAECFEWHTAQPCGDAGTASPVTQRRQAELLAEAAVESFHILPHLRRAERRVAAGAHAAAGGEDLDGVEIALEDMLYECSDAHSMSWTLLSLWLDVFDQHTSRQSAAAVVSAAGDLWRSDLTKEYERTLLTRMQEQFDTPAETASQLSAQMRDLKRADSQDRMEIIRSEYGVDAVSRSQRRRDRRRR